MKIQEACPKALLAAAISTIVSLHCSPTLAQDKTPSSQDAAAAPAQGANDATIQDLDQLFTTTEAAAPSTGDAKPQGEAPPAADASTTTETQAPAQDSSAQAAPAPSATTADGSTDAKLETIPVAAAAKNSSDSTAIKYPRTSAQLEEIVVTATKREENLREIPASITALSGQELENSGAQGIDDVVKRVPGVNIASENGFTRITIRGISSLNNTSSTTGILLGNVSFADQYVPIVALDQQLFDLRGVEVLKGPQGTLFGASALNGAIRYVPEPAALGVYSAKYFAQYTSIEHGGADPIYGAAVNVPVGDTAAIRIMGFDRKSPGYVDNLQLNIKDSNHLSQSGGRVMGKWQPSDDTAISLIGSTQKTSIFDISLTDGLNGNLSSNNRARRSPQVDGYDMGGLTVEHNFNWATLVSETAYVHKKSEHFYENTRNVIPSGTPPLLGIVGGGRSNTLSQELRLVSPTDDQSNWKWITGVFGSRQKLTDIVDLQLGNALLPPAVTGPFISPILDGLGLGGIVNPNGNIDLLNVFAKVKIEEIALFGEVTRKFGDWELALGGRLYRTSSFGNNRQQGAVLAAVNLNPTTYKTGGIAERAFNPKASLTWHASDDIMSYATISKGFRVGGLQPGVTLPISATQAPAFFKSDIIWNYETGVRAEWLDNTLSTDLTAFYIDWRNPQVFQPDSTTNLQYLDNAGRVKSPGFDFALRWITPFQLMLSSTATYANTVTTAPFKTGSGTVSQPGSPWPYAPKWQSATTLSYPLTLNDYTITMSVTHTYMGKSVNNLNEQKPIFNYQLLDAQIGVLSTAHRWIPEFNLTVNNLLDKRGVTTNITQGQTIDGGYTQPRTINLRLSGSF